MNLQFIHYFLLLANARNFTRAAERAHVVQSTFSAGIKKLEESLGTVLFERDKRNVSLTPSGEALLPKARQLLMLWGEIQETFDPQQVRYLRLGFVQNLSLATVMPFINNFKASYPLSEVHITEDKHEVLLSLLENEKVDAFFTEQRPIDLTKYQTAPVASEKLFLAVNHRHPLANKDAIKLQYLQGEAFISRSHCALYQEVFDKLEEFSVQPKNVFTAHNNETVAALISSGMGLTLMPKLTFSLPDIRFIPLQDVDFVRHIILVRKKHTDSKALDTFLDTLKNGV